MPNTTNTPMNQQIQDAIAAQSTIGQEIKDRYAAQPAYESQARADIFGGDGVLSSLQTGFSDKVKELYNYDQAKNNTFSAPATTESGVSMNINPMIGERANQQAFKSAVSAKEDAWQLYETRKNVLGDALDKAIRLYESKTKMKESERAAIGDTVDSLQKLYAEENDSAYKRGLISKEDAKTSNAVAEEDAQTEFIKRFGLTAYNNLGSVSDRKANAKIILDMVASGQQVNPRDFMNATDKKAFDAADSLLQKVEEAGREFVGQGGAMGTGPLAQFVPSVIAGKKTNKLRTAIATVGPEKIKEISGVAVSDKEFARLEALLPQNGLPEEENYRRLVDMGNRIRANQELKSRMIMENITASQAIDKYGTEIWSKYGLGGTPEQGSQTGGGWEDTGNTK